MSGDYWVSVKMEPKTLDAPDRRPPLQILNSHTYHNKTSLNIGVRKSGEFPKLIRKVFRERCFWLVGLMYLLIRLVFPCYYSSSG